MYPFHKSTCWRCWCYSITKETHDKYLVFEGHVKAQRGCLVIREYGDFKGFETREWLNSPLDLNQTNARLLMNRCDHDHKRHQVMLMVKSIENKHLHLHFIPSMQKGLTPSLWAMMKCMHWILGIWQRDLQGPVLHLLMPKPTEEECCEEVDQCAWRCKHRNWMPPGLNGWKGYGPCPFKSLGSKQG